MANKKNENNLWLIYRNEESVRKKLLEKRREAFMEELPDVLLKLTLLLNAGLVLNTALEKLVADEADSDKVAIRIFKDALARSSLENASSESVLADIAKASGEREFIRFISLLCEHSRTGSELSEKLDREREHMWELRLNNARAQAKRAETKLCLPLMMLLVSLLLISTAPAFMQM